MPGISGGRLYIGEDLLVFWGHEDDPGSGLYDRALKKYENSATVTYQLKDAAESVVASGSLSYVDNSRGYYQGVIEEDVLDAADEGQVFHLEITATASGDRVGFRRIDYIAEYHGNE